MVRWVSMIGLSSRNVPQLCLRFPVEQSIANPACRLLLSAHAVRTQAPRARRGRSLPRPVSSFPCSGRIAHTDNTAAKQLLPWRFLRQMKPAIPRPPRFYTHEVRRLVGGGLSQFLSVSPPAKTSALFDRRFLKRGQNNDQSHLCLHTLFIRSRGFVCLTLHSRCSAAPPPDYSG